MAASPSFVLGGQWFAADLFALVVVLLGWFGVGLHVSSVQVLVRLRADVFKDVRHSELELVCNGRDPGVVFCFEHLLWSSQVQVS